MSRQPTPYEILGLTKTASAEEIKSAYRKLAKKFHPDLNPGNKEAEKKFKELNEANEQIGSPQARATYDRGETETKESVQNPYGGAGKNYYYQTQGDGPESQGRYSSQFGGMDEDLFESIFLRARGGSTRASPTDEVYKMEIEFRDSVRGGEREITLPSGKRLAVKIPVGIESGKKLRFAGLAASGGDVLIEINVRPSPQFTRVGNHLEIEIPISISEAILGGEAKVPTMDGSILLKVPAGVSSGQKLRAPGLGVSAHGGETAGDLHVLLKIVAPKAIDAEFKSAVEAWQKRQSDHPREGVSS